MALMLDAIWSAFEVDFRRKFKSAMERGLVGVTREIEQFARRLGEEEFGNPADALAEFEEIAANMRGALVSAYTATVEAEKIVPSYRQGAGRLSGGVLRTAIEDPSMAVATPNGILYINKPLLDLEAKHWARLNFGAAGSGVRGGAGKRQPVYLDGRVLFYVGSEAGPRPAFSMPAGIWRDAGGAPVDRIRSAGPLNRTVDRFYPTSRPLITPTRGIRPRNFIDAGFTVLASEFGPALDRLFQKWTQESAKFPTPPVVVEA